MENTINPNNELMTPKRNLPRDVFLHLLAIVALYWSAIAFTTLCWQYINHFFPDALQYGYDFNVAIRSAISALIILFPVFILTSWFLNRIYKKESVVRESKIRKWLIYLTLFIAALVIIGDLVFIINTFLGGELTVRFILKALSIIVVAGVIFGYYLDDVRRSSSSPMTKYITGGISLIVLGFIVGAFFIVGSPQSARMTQFDLQRTYDLQNIQYHVVTYWQNKGALPDKLSDLDDSISGYTAPLDPETRQPYEYTPKDALSLSFELCANFKTVLNTNNLPKASQPVPIGYNDVYSQNFDHQIGRTCFQRTIDKELYPRTPK